MMIYLLTYYRVDGDYHCTEHVFYDIVTEKFYGIIIINDYTSSTTYYVINNRYSMYNNSFEYKLPKKLNILEIEINVSYREKYFDIELEKLIFDKL